jgi:hypothetical protein
VKAKAKLLIAIWGTEQFFTILCAYGLEFLPRFIKLFPHSENLTQTLFQIFSSVL